MTRRRIPIALTVGDPAGIGPEIAAALLASGTDYGADLVLIGSAAAMAAAAEKAGARMPSVIGTADSADGPALLDAFSPGLPVMIDTGRDRDFPAGGPSAAGGAISGEAVEKAALLASEGFVEGIVTGPVSKEALGLAGYSYRGHTDMLSAMLDAPDCQMMMVSPAMRIVILTRDIPLAGVPAALTRERLATGVRVTARALRELWGIEEPRIDIAALNPHGGDGGVTGTEERDIIMPAIEALAAEGIDARGPFPADTLFVSPGRRGCDAFVALYHDQGMIPFKMSGFDRGVNMTIGLPVVRTSVCHGTAYDITGRGEAESGSLAAALELAVSCCLTRTAEGRAAL
ncbi:MAG TPA: 4-hydroxythreonine-4-phosphate dehydrogenase PdxA [Candidatus Eisenbacteria bacterium]|uniref:4-hydroxythreonine-4-phosphate dehydrogenase PdxA n=1 Tax=Eiseniibacteriota bacterium TaxID=2212470 RepID=A0A7V2F3Q7_UNCEI|nr:4-hydroxythreonine-4-phosphate dehydrogenase PdxA [Candidatus Eisenbacteria bacterium]